MTNPAGSSEKSTLMHILHTTWDHTPEDWYLKHNIQLETTKKKKLVFSFVAISNVSLEIIFPLARIRTVVTPQMRNLSTFKTKMRQHIPLMTV